jgi:hypothetical protein
MIKNNMTIGEIIEFNKRYSYIVCVIDFKKDDNLIQIKNIPSVNLICGFGDSRDFNESLMDESWNDIFKDRFKGDGFYNVEIVYRNIDNYDDYQHRIYYEIEDIKFYKYDQSELNYSNTIPFDWDNIYL